MSYSCSHCTDVWEVPVTPGGSIWIIKVSLCAQLLPNGLLTSCHDGSCMWHTGGCQWQAASPSAGRLGLCGSHVALLPATDWVHFIPCKLHLLQVNEQFEIHRVVTGRPRGRCHQLPNLLYNWL